MMTEHFPGIQENRTSLEGEHYTTRPLDRDDYKAVGSPLLARVVEPITSAIRMPEIPKIQVPAVAPVTHFGLKVYALAIEAAQGLRS